MFAYSKKDIPTDLTDEQKIIVKTLPQEQIVRPSVFLASLLSAIQPKGTISMDEAFIHLKGDESPLPYTTGFYNADLSAIFGIDINRIGIFDNYFGKELNTNLADKALEDGKIIKLNSPKPKSNRAIYQRIDLGNYRKQCIEKLVNALVRMRGGAKLSQFGADVSPKAIVCVGLSIKAPIFNNLFDPYSNQPGLKIELLREIIQNYSDKIETPVFIGLRKDNLHNEKELRELKEVSGINLQISTPLKLPTLLGEYI